MFINSSTNESTYFIRRNLEWILLILSSILLGIWAVKETIALRNILLVTGSILSMYYIVQEFMCGKLKEQLTIWKLTPITLLVLVFFWVSAHYLLFSIDSINQLKEIQSTWLRALLASMVGLGTGLAIRNYPNRFIILWLGILMSFFVLFYQYIPRALAAHKLLVPDYDHYLFHLKINTVLMGAILMAGISGALLDYLRKIDKPLGFRALALYVFWGIILTIVMWSFVYIVDSKNGVVSGVIIYICFWIALLVLIIRIWLHSIKKAKNLVIFLCISVTSLIILFSVLSNHIQINASWKVIIKDAIVAVQIDRYPHWSNINAMGYPKDNTGRQVTSNHYERLAWATAGLRGIVHNPLGIGVLSKQSIKDSNILDTRFGNNSIYKISTHSGWIELGLAFGIPILLLIFISLGIILIINFKHSYPGRLTTFFLTLIILQVYSSGEVAISHGLEILFFILAFLCGLLLVNPKTIRAKLV